MYLLGPGRRAFLDFLRNLTSQVALLALVLVVANKLDMAHLNLGRLLGFLALLGLWAMAAWANSTLFLEEAMTALQPIQRAKRIFKFRGHNGLRFLAKTIAFTWRHKKIAFVEAFLMALIIETGLLIAAANSIAAAAALAEKAKI